MYAAGAGVASAAFGRAVHEIAVAMLAATKRCGDGGRVGDELVKRDAQGVGCGLTRVSCKLAVRVRDGSGRHDAWLERVVTAGVWYGGWWRRYRYWQWQK
jgi:hypothetical protein